jgi:hypothetical protein
MSNSEKVPRSKVFRDRAEECRTMAALFHGEALLFRVAADYARMADQAAIFELQDADREAGIIPPVRSHGGSLASLRTSHQLREWQRVPLDF